MHVLGFPLDLSWFLQFIATAFFIAFGLLHLVKNTASKYFTLDANFDSSNPLGRRRHHNMPGVAATTDSCALCSNLAKKQCSGCKLVRYCSEACQRSHWRSEHKTKCKEFQLSGKVSSTQPASLQLGRKAFSTVALVPSSGTIVKQSKEVLFPYEDFVKLFNWDKPGFPPCGLLNCGNSCFANVVLQCLACTRPLVAYLLEKGHRRECRRNDWCFLCEFQTHVQRAFDSQQPFSPLSILSRLSNIGGNLGYGKQEDAHEFMRFAIDTMQSVCLDEFGGEKALHPGSQETTLVQHIFGGYLQSQVICTKCNNISNQYENMMDLTVEIHGDAASLEECLDQFTVREKLHGDNMYKCDGCNDYVTAWKRLTVRQAPNILTIALKRFQSGRFGKLNKRITFPETLDLSPYMSEAGDGNDVYKLYAVVVHVDMLNASFFGHYICYTKDFSSNWYKIDDCKVKNVDLEEVLLQGAYMLLYSRVCARTSCLQPIESLGKEQQTVKVIQEEDPHAKQPVQCVSSDRNLLIEASSGEMDLSSILNSEDTREDMEMIDSEASSSIQWDVEVNGNGYSNLAEGTTSRVHANRLVSGVVSSLSETCKSATSSLNIESPCPDSGIEDGNIAQGNGATMLDFSDESSLLKQNCANGEMSCDVSIGGFNSSDEILDGMNPADFEDEVVMVENGKGLPSSSRIKEAAGKSGRSSSGAKLRPLFSPGFLEKQFNKKPVKKDGKAPLAPGKIASACNSDKGISGFAKPGSLGHNGLSIKAAGKGHSRCNGSLRPSSLEEQTGKDLNNCTMVPNESGEFISTCNGDSGAFVASENGNSTASKSEHPLLGKTLSYDDKLCQPSVTAPCEIIRTDSA